MNSDQDRIGIFLYFPGNEDTTRISNFLQNWQPGSGWEEIRGFRANAQIITKLIPDHLQQSVQSWLLLARSEYANELLIIPFPEPRDASILTDMKKFHSSVSALLDYINGNRQPWYPSNGYRNLIELMIQKRATPFSYISPPKRFQVMRLDQSLNSVLRETEEDSRQAERMGYELSAFAESIENIQRSREETLQLILTTRDTESIQKAVEDLDQVMLREGERLSGSILAKHNSKQVVPEIVDKFSQIMDEETKSFLISAATVARFASKYLPGDFDFSIPGCGLWKAVERELNLSLIWHIRRSYKRVREDPFKLIPGPEIILQAGDKEVSLSKPERIGLDLPKGIELGNMEYLLRSASENGVEATIKEVGNSNLANFVLGDENNSLSDRLRQLGILRNKYAHIKRMPYTQYEQLSSIVLSAGKQGEESLLAQVLWMKDLITSYWKNPSLHVEDSEMQVS
jgi:hypothetical protein